MSFTGFEVLGGINGFLKYFKNTFWLLFERAFTLVAALAISILLARYLGPEVFGKFSYSQSIIGLLSVISLLGLESVFVKEYLKNKEIKSNLISTALALRLLVSLLIFLIVFASTRTLKFDNQITTIVIILSISLIFDVFNVFSWYFNAEVKGKVVAKVSFFTVTISSLLKLVFVLVGASVEVFALMIVFEKLFIGILLVIFFYTQDHKNAYFVPKVTLAKKMLKQSWFLMLSSFVVSIYMKLDQLMIGELLNFSQVGIYSVAVKLAEAWYMIPIVLLTSLFPAILNSKESNSLQYNNRMQYLYNFMVLISVVIAIPVTFFSGIIIKILYGDAYQEASVVLSIYIWASVFVFLGIANGRWLVAEGYEKYSLYRTLAGLLVNVALNFLLIPVYGLKGAAIATLFSQFFASYLFFSFIPCLKPAFKQQTRSLLGLDILFFIQKKIFR